MTPIEIITCKWPTLWSYDPLCYHQARFLNLVLTYCDFVHFLCMQYLLSALNKAFLIFKYIHTLVLITNAVIQQSFGDTNNFQKNVVAHNDPLSKSARGWWPTLRVMEIDGCGIHSKMSTFTGGGRYRACQLHCLWLSVVYICTKIVLTTNLIYVISL